MFAALRQADLVFSAHTALLLKDDDGAELGPHFAGSLTVDEKERAVADWVWHNRKKAGRFTDTLPSGEGFHVPLVREGNAVGVLIVRVPPEATLTLSQRDRIIEGLRPKSPLLVEREHLRAAGNGKNRWSNRRNFTALFWTESRTN